MYLFDMSSRTFSFSLLLSKTNSTSDIVRCSCDTSSYIGSNSADRDEPKKPVVVIDGIESEGHDSIYALFMNETGSRTYYVTMNGGKTSEAGEYVGGKHQMVINGEKSEEYDIIAYPQYSTDGEHYAYIAGVGGYWDDEGGYHGGKYFLVYDGVKGEEHDLIMNLHLSDDGTHYLYKRYSDGVWEDGKYIHGKETVVYDGQPDKAYDNIYNLEMSSDGLHYLYTAKKAAEQSGFDDQYSGKYTTVYDGQESDWYDYITETDLSDNGEHYIYHGIRYESAEDDGEPVENHYVVYDGVPSTAYDHVVVDNILLSDDGSHYVYTVLTGGSFNSRGLLTGGKQKFYYDGTASEEYDYIYKPELSDSGEHFSYIACSGGWWLRNGEHIGGKYVFVYNDTKSDEYDAIWSYNFPQNGNHYFFIGVSNISWRGTSMILKYSTRFTAVCDGEKSEDYRNISGFAVDIVKDSTTCTLQEDVWETDSRALL